jgi:branched-chain amino acid transport system permease protein
VRIGIESFVALSAYLLLVMGRISFGQQAFFAIGAYAAGMATALFGMPLAVGIAVGGLVAGAGGALFALPMAATRGLWFAAGTLAFGELVRVGLLGFHYQLPVGGELVGPAGADGFRGVRRLFTGGVTVPVFAMATWVILAAVIVVVAAVSRARWGEALRMIGEDEDLAAAVGIRVWRVKTAALATAAALAGVGGGLFVHYATYVEPGHVDVMLGAHGVAYGLIGGLGTPLGPPLGVALDIGVLESIRVLSGYRMIIFGGLVVVFLIARPRGLLDEATVQRLGQLAARLRTRP